MIRINLLAIERERTKKKAVTFQTGQKLTIQTRAAPVRTKAAAKAVKGKPRKQATGRIVKKAGT